MKLMECVESKEDPLIQIVRTHQHYTNSTLIQTVGYLKKYFQSGTKQIKSIKAQNVRREMGRKRDS
jgi:hypothetical protein